MNSGAIWWHKNQQIFQTRIVPKRETGNNSTREKIGGREGEVCCEEFERKMEKEEERIHHKVTRGTETESTIIVTTTATTTTKQLQFQGNM